MRKTNLPRLLAPRPERIFVSEFERGEIGADLLGTMTCPLCEDCGLDV